MTVLLEVEALGDHEYVHVEALAVLRLGGEPHVRLREVGGRDDDAPEAERGRRRAEVVERGDRGLDEDVQVVRFGFLRRVVPEGSAPDDDEPCPRLRERRDQRPI